MKTPALATLAAAVVLAAAFAPFPAQSATGATTAYYDLATRQYDRMTAGQYEGRLRLTITPDGIVSGTFMNTSGEVSSLVGGLTGANIWLRFGDSWPTRQRLFYGTFVDGKLAATARNGLDTWTLEGRPAAR